MSERPLLIGVADLLARMHSRAPVRVESVLDELSTSIALVPFGEPVRVDVTLESIPDGIVVTGTVMAPWVGQCARCVREVSGTIGSEVTEVFQHDPAEGETYPVVGDHIDLEPIVREAVLLDLPLAPLCDPQCRGLCAQCGADLNEGDCGCEANVIDPRWAALTELRLEEDD